uniref:DUF4587 domain-containing protein n=1 Tax=Anabas testudineus TaxID=64144 RepID=A0A3Q1H982_ANATE
MEHSTLDKLMTKPSTSNQPCTNSTGYEITKALQQPTTILQQLPAAMMPPGLAPSIRPSGHVKEDLVELMMIQNAQMHQVIMNNMSMSALRLFGYSSPAPGTEVKNEADPEVYHHYYEPAPHLSYPPWVLPQATLYQEDPNKPNLPTCPLHFI